MVHINTMLHYKKNQIYERKILLVGKLLIFISIIFMLLTEICWQNTEIWWSLFNSLLNLLVFDFFFGC